MATIINVGNCVTGSASVNCSSYSSYQVDFGGSLNSFGEFSGSANDSLTIYASDGFTVLATFSYADSGFEAECDGGINLTATNDGFGNWVLNGNVGYSTNNSGSSSPTVTNLSINDGNIVIKARSCGTNGGGTQFGQSTVTAVGVTPPTPSPTPTPSPSPSTPIYYLSVNGGQPGITGTAGSGYYAPGANVNVSATIAGGYVFAVWSDDAGYLTGGSTTNPNVFVMPPGPGVHPGGSYVITPLASVASTPTPTPTPTVTPTKTVTPTPTPTQTIGASPTPTPTVTPSISITPTVTPTKTVTPTVTPTITVTPSISITPTVTPSLTPTPTPTPSPGVLGIYTPWTVATTNSPVWVQSVYPLSQGFTKYRIQWAQNRNLSLSGDYYAIATTNNFFLYSYSIPASGESYYTVGVQGLEGAGGLPRTLTNRFYIKDEIPTFEVDGFYDPTMDTPSIPYGLSAVLVGCNEWVTSDVINASFDKIHTNFEYLRKISQVLLLNNSIPLIEWCAQFVPTTTTTPATAFAWKTNITGLNWDNSYNSYATASATGITDGIIKGFRSYRFSDSSAPDYYNYIMFSGQGSIPDHFQIRSNDYLNTLILSATSIGASLPSFSNLSAFDVLNEQIYALDDGTVYRLNTDADAGSLLPLNQVGGIVGTMADTNKFNSPRDIRSWQDKIYVADSQNSCIKVYNTALSWVKTLYVDALSAYSIPLIDINRDNGNTFLLGQTFAPVAPVLTNVSFVSSVTADAGYSTTYNVSWVHDGLRLLDNTTNVLSAFSIYGLVSGGTTYTLLASSATLSATVNLPYTNNQTITYTAASGVTYSDFKIQALGNNGFNSNLSNNQIGPIVFESPYRMFEIDYSNTLVNTFVVPNNTSLILPTGNIQSNTNINDIIIDPTGAFLYIVTDDYIYKYLTTGKALNRFAFPSKSSLGGSEKLKTAFIDDRLNFFVTTDKRIFKFVDVPLTLDLYNTDAIETLFTPLSSCYIDSNEYIQDWVYNKSFLRLIRNHEILFRTIQGKYSVNLDKDGNLLTTNTATNFVVAPLSSIDITDTFVINKDYFVHSNEFVTCAAVNRAITKLYNLQLQILEVASPTVTRALPTNLNNVITV